MDREATERMLQGIVGGCPFHRILGLSLAGFSAAEGSVRIAAEVRAELSRTDERIELHGGVIASLLDIAADCAVALATGRGVPTIGLSLDYLRPAGPGPVFATGRLLRAGRTVAVAETRLEDAGGRLLAAGQASFLTARRREPPPASEAE